jgi:hypothetical protein
VVLFGVLLGKSFYDVRAAVRTGKDEIGSAVSDGKKEVDSVRQTTTGLKDQVKELQTNM